MAAAQYTSHEFQAFLKDQGIVGSMSAVGAVIANVSGVNPRDAASSGATSGSSATAGALI